MKKLGLMVVFVLAAIACGDMAKDILDSGVPDAGAQAPAATFVGYTSGIHELGVSGDSGGLFNSYAACQSEFGNTARICTVAEVLATTNLPSPPPENQFAWMVETLASIPTCWNSGRNEGPALSSTGYINRSDCYQEYVLACCRVD